MADKIKCLKGGQANVYLICGLEGSILVDTGISRYREKIAHAGQEAEVKLIVLTHGHFDHIWGLDALRDAANAAAEADGLKPVKAYACEAERELLKSPRLNVSEQAGRACATYADVYVKDGEEISLAGMTCKVIGHPRAYGGRLLLLFRRGGDFGERGHPLRGIRGTDGLPYGQHGHFGALHQGKAVRAAGGHAGVFRAWREHYYRL